MDADEDEITQARYFKLIGIYWFSLTDMNNITSIKEKEIIDTFKNDKIVKLPWVTKLEPKLGKEFYIFGIKTMFTSGRNLKNLICRNRSKLLPTSFPRVYQLD